MRYPFDRNVHRPHHLSLSGRYYFVSARTYYALPFLRAQEVKKLLRESFDKAVNKFNLLSVAWVILNNHYHWMFRAPDNSINAVSPKPSGTDTLQGVTDTRTDRIHPVTELFQVGKIIGYVHGRSSNLINKPHHQESQKYVYDFTPYEFGILKTHPPAGGLGPKYEKLDKARTKKFQHLIDSQDMEGLKKFMRSLPKIWYQYTDHIIRDEDDFYCHLNYIYQNPVKHGYTKDMLNYEFCSIHEAIKRRGKEFILDCFAKYPVADFNPDFEDW